jgi:ribonuclease R
MVTRRKKEKSSPKAATPSPGRSRSKRGTPALPADVDPFLTREQEKYENPIPSREFIMMRLAHVGVPMTLPMIADDLKLHGEEPLEALRRRLRAMEREGQVIRNRRGGYGLAEKMDLVRGRIIAHPEGFGFLVPDDGSDDLYLPEPQMRSLLHGDRVLVSPAGLDRRGRREAVLVDVLERHNSDVIGRFFNKGGVCFVEPNNRRLHQDIVVAAESCRHVESGQIVVVRLTQQPTKNRPPFGEIVQVVGEHRAPGMEIDIAIRSHELPHEWPEEVLQELPRLSLEISDLISDRHVEGRPCQRENMRHLPFVTIDGEDSRDFDDAVYCEPRGKGWRLRVAIADVSAYVKPGTALDEHAKKRGNSVYFPSRVIPMLPEILSNELCSLNPHVERLALVCDMQIDCYGNVRKTQFFEAVICSSARLTYTQVAKVLAGETDQFPYPELLLHIDHLHQLFRLLLKRRQRRGAIEFETTETRIIFDEQQKIQEIVAVTRNDAHRLIEEMMLAANVATADFLVEREMPLLFRNHEGPNAEKLTDLRQFLGGLALRLAGKDAPTALHYAKLVERIQDRPDKQLIQTVLLRSLRMAFYSPINLGHFGLAYPAYTHFTSPIRRYPDLLVHRAIKHCLREKTPETFNYAQHELESLGEQCSMTERRADEATRDAIDWLKCDFMRDKVGKIYEGMVYSVTSFGLFVQLDGVFIEGLLHVTALRNDYYHFDPARHCLYGERSGTVYRLSDRLKVRVMRVDVDERKIDFELVS